jgi:protein TonB
MARPMLDRVQRDERGTAAAEQSGGTGGAVLRPDALGPIAPPARRSHVAMVMSFALATLLHAGVGLALISGRADPYGAGGSELEAISVEVVTMPARALESRVASASREAATSASVDQIEGAAEASPSAAPTPPVEHERKAEPEMERPVADPLKTETAKEQPVAEPPQLTLTRPDPTPPEPDAVTLPVREESPPKAAPEKPKSPQHSASNPAAEAGGASSRSDTGADRPTPAAALVSPGAIQAFTRGVVDALARTRPKGVKGGARGTAKVAFAVAEGGGLEFVRIARSSGHEALDEAAVAAVKRAAFPAPPSGMTLADRTYEVPYYFR